MRYASRRATSHFVSVVSGESSIMCDFLKPTFRRMSRALAPCLLWSTIASGACSSYISGEISLAPMRVPTSSTVLMESSRFSGNCGLGRMAPFGIPRRSMMVIIAADSDMPCGRAGILLRTAGRPATQITRIGRDC